MKRLLLLSFVLAFVMTGFAQERATLSNDLRNLAVEKVSPVLETMNLSHDVLPASIMKLDAEEAEVGNTYYDLQSNVSMQNRIFVYDDGTIGAVYTIGFDFPGFADDRGTGYNYYDGEEWGPFATVKLESDKTGWPAYSAWGENGEINLAHYSGAAYDGLVYSRRDTKGTGDWTLIDYLTPVGNEMVWPRMTTGGINHSVVHQIAITRPVANNGTIYQGLDGALLYSRSSDGANTWEVQDLLIDEVNSSNYLNFSGDTYEVEADGDNVAILYGESWQDLGLLKSTDGGDSWSHTIIWECPYPLWDPNNLIPTDTFYCADGSHGLDFDQNGMVHVVFGINRAHSDGAGAFWFPFVGGIGYWNENRATFSNDRDALCPFSDCAYTELEEDYSLIGWSQDINGNGTLDILDEIGTYYMGLSSMPQIEIDDMNNVYVVYSSVTETYDNGTMSYRHLWGRYSGYGDFWGPFVDLTSNIIHIFDECVFPSIASTSDDNLYLIYQRDTEPGLAVRGDEHPYVENIINFMSIPKTDLKVGIEETAAISDYDVKQNYPNPFTGTSTVEVNVHHKANMTLEVMNMMGQVVYTVDAGVAQPGMNEITIDASKLTSGVYFYTVKAGEASVTKKMIVE